MSEPIPEQALPEWRRAVLKVGSNLLAADGGGLSPRYAAGLAAFIAASRAQGRQVVLVSSGAVAAGRALLHDSAAGGSDLAARQALAALGQALVVGLWQGLSTQPVAQVLLSHDDVRHRRRYLNARTTLRELLVLDALIVVNENDTVAVDELKLGDNDNLAAIVAALVEADLLLIASDIDALYTADPQCDPTARPLSRIATITPEILAMAGGSGSVMGTGGMRTKLEAALKAASAGIATVLFDGRNPGTVAALSQQQLHGSLFLAPPARRLQARKYWLQQVPATAGAIRIDAGAVRALREGGASLLPGGVLAVSGDFRRGDMVDILDVEGRPIARGLSQYHGSEVARLIGAHSRDIETRLGYNHGNEVVHRDDLLTRDEWLPEQES